MRFWVIILITLVLDQGSKYIVQSYMDVGQSIGVINNLLNFTYVLNPGAAFGYFAYQTNLFIVITVLVIIFIIYYNYRLPAIYSAMRIGLALQLGGAAGNLIDRVRTGYVIDFFDLVFFPPIFNIADAAIIFGIVFFVFSLWQEGRDVVVQEKGKAGSPPGKKFKRALIGNNIEEMDNYLDRVAGNIEVFVLANNQLKEQITRLYKEIDNLKRINNNKNDLILGSRESLDKVKHETGAEIEKAKVDSSNKIEEMRKKKETVMLENIKLKQEKDQLIINKDYYNKTIKTMDECSSIIYYLAATMGDHVENKSEAIMREAESIRMEASELKEKVYPLHRNALNENEKLKTILKDMNEKLKEHENNEKYLEDAISFSKIVCKKIEIEGWREAELIRREAGIEAQRIINDAIRYAGIIFPQHKEGHKKILEMLSKNNIYFSNLLKEKLSLIDKEEIFNADEGDI